MARSYYSVRTGQETDDLEIDFAEFRRLVLSIYRRLDDEGYFTEAFGQDCVDGGPTVGSLGTDLELFFVQKLRKRGLWPIPTKIDGYSEADLFAVIELLFDYVSIPRYKDYHSWDNCGYHYGNFDAHEGKVEFANEINSALRDYGGTYQLSGDGEIICVADEGLEELVEDPLPELEPANVQSKVAAARSRFRRYGASIDDRRDAVRTLADVLEYLRPELKQILLPKDESDLFNIANNFAIRHHNRSQKDNYDQELWLKGMFYTYLATIRVVVDTLARESQSRPSQPSF